MSGVTLPLSADDTKRIGSPQSQRRMAEMVRSAGSFVQG